MSAESSLSAPSGTLILDDGRTLAWDECGDESGDPVIYMHGVPSGRFLAPGRARAAAEANARIIAPDRPGCGMSSFQDSRRVIDWPKDVKAIVDHLGFEHYTILGVSGGGPYALACAAAGDPRLLRTAVVSGIGPLDTPERMASLHDTNRWFFEVASQGADDALPLIRAATSPDNKPTDVLTRLGPEDHKFLSSHPEILDELLEMNALASAKGVDGLAYDAWLTTQSWGFDLSDIPGPVDFYGGDHDDNVPIQHTVDQAALVPRSTLTVWPDAGHTALHLHFGEVLCRLLRPV